MKEVKAFVRPEKVNNVIMTLEEQGINGMTVIDVNAIAGWADPDKTTFNIKYVEKYCRIIKFELICEDDDVNAIVMAIREAGFTGKAGDGKIFISEIDDVISIRTGKHGMESI